MPPLPHALLFPTLPSPLPTPSLSKSAHFSFHHRYSTLRFPYSRRLLRCSIVSVSPDAPRTKGESRGTHPSPAEVSRTIMELSSTGTLSTLTPDGWPLGIGARFVVDAQGAPALCLNQPDSLIAIGGRSSFHVQVMGSILWPSVWIFTCSGLVQDGVIWYGNEDAMNCGDCRFLCMSDDFSVLFGMVTVWAEQITDSSVHAARESRQTWWWITSEGIIFHHHLSIIRTMSSSASRAWRYQLYQ